jgi:hypothetical protein
MSRILAFTSGPDDWRALLADPVKHWRTGYSARTLAYCWEAADGFHPEVAAALGRTADPLLADEPAGTIRYQLLHRAASAVVTADQ